MRQGDGGVVSTMRQTPSPCLFLIIDFSGIGIYNLSMPGLVKVVIQDLTDHAMHCGTWRLDLRNDDYIFQLHLKSKQQ